MILSKSFGYALRGILFVAFMSDSGKRVQLDEIAKRLSVPRHFLAKVMKKIVKQGILTSVRGPNGGFCINETTLNTRLIQLVDISGDNLRLDSCILRLRKCSSLHPCPLHQQVEALRQQWFLLLNRTTLEDLLKKDQPEFISSIAIADGI